MTPGLQTLGRLSATAREIIAHHPVNERRLSRGEKPVTDVWFWGQGKRPAVPTLEERFGIRGGVITAVDVVGGLGRLAGLDRIEVPGITGFIDTNYLGKGEYALAALEDHDLIFVHVESTDEARPAFVHVSQAGSSTAATPRRCQASIARSAMLGACRERLARKRPPAVSTTRFFRRFTPLTICRPTTASSRSLRRAPRTSRTPSRAKAEAVP